MPELLTASEVAARLRIARQSIYELLKRDESFPRPLRIMPRAPRWRACDVDAWLAAQTPDAA